MTSGRNSSIRILIVDDCAIVREGLRAIVERQPDMRAVCEAASAREAIEQLLPARPDLILLSFCQSLASCIETITTVRKAFSCGVIVVLSGSHTGEDIRRALQAGAHSLLPGNVQIAQLSEAIRAVHRGQRYIPTLIAAQLAQSIAGPTLSRRELDVLELIAQGVSNKRIGLHLGVTEGTVKSHVNNILGKLSANDRTDAVTKALKLGLLSLD